ncbi:endolytic transglycosylase MltG [soil metagenome]
MIEDQEITTELPEPRPLPPQQPINGQKSGLHNPHRKLKRSLLWIVASVVAAIIITTVSFLIWYRVQLAPVGGDTNQHIVVKIASGASPSSIGQQLQQDGVIRSNVAFDIYTRLNGKRNILQAGTYRLSPAESVQDIVGHLVKGDVDKFSITFYPGGTLSQHRKVLISAGYSESEVDLALKASYDSPLFVSKLASTDLEGYIYGETYQFSAGASVVDILQRTFNEYYSALQENGIIEGIKAQGLSLYQGITLASIVQKEVLSPASPDPSVDQKQVAQVFYSRLSSGMTLGSDVTYQYAADKLGVARDTNLDSPYNTRRYAGLPPGPIASPGLTALKAVAAPASTDYLFFLSGDDDITYFGRTDAEHQANIREHCAKKCSIL